MEPTPPTRQPRIQSELERTIRAKSALCHKLIAEHNLPGALYCAEHIVKVLKAAQSKGSADGSGTDGPSK